MTTTNIVTARGW